MHRTARTSFTAAAFVLLVALSACTKEPPQPELADIQAARRATLSLDVQLNQDIFARLDRDDDPVAVYMAYRDHIPGYVTDISKREQVDLSRTALRVRNPANRADDWEIKQLEIFQFSLEAGLDISTLQIAEVVTENNQQIFRWIRPMQAVENCLVCHGEEIDPRILKLLSQDYAEDEGTGYYANEMLGAYSVSIPLDLSTAANAGDAGGKQ